MIEVPGLTPRSPVMTLGPVLVTVEAPRTAKLCAVPKEGAICARAAWIGIAIGSAESNPMEANLAKYPFSVRVRLIPFFISLAPMLNVKNPIPKQRESGDGSAGQVPEKGVNENLNHGVTC